MPLVTNRLMVLKKTFEASSHNVTTMGPVWSIINKSTTSRRKSLLARFGAGDVEGSCFSFSVNCRDFSGNSNTVPSKTHKAAEDFSDFLKGIPVPCRFSAKGTVMNLTTATTTKGSPKQSFVLVDPNGLYFQCCATGRNTGNLEDGLRIALYFGSGRTDLRLLPSMPSRRTLPSSLSTAAASLTSSWITSSPLSPQPVKSDYVELAVSQCCLPSASVPAMAFA